MISKRAQLLIVLYQYFDQMQYPQLYYEISAELFKCFNDEESTPESILQQIVSQINEIDELIEDYSNIHSFYEKQQYLNLFINSAQKPDYAVHCHLKEIVKCYELSKYDDLIRFTLISDNFVQLDSKQLSEIILNYENRETADISIRHLCYQLHSELLDSISSDNE